MIFLNRKIWIMYVFLICILLSCQEEERNFNLKGVDAISESTASYYEYFKLDAKCYSITKHKDLEFYRLDVGVWNTTTKDLEPLHDEYRRFEDSLQLVHYIDSLQKGKTIERNNKLLFEGALPQKLIAQIPKGFSILQQSKTKDDYFLLVLRNKTYELKVVLFDNVKQEYKELFDDGNPHLMELSFIDIDGDGFEDLIKRDFFIYDDFDEYTGKIFKIER